MNTEMTWKAKSSLMLLLIIYNRPQLLIAMELASNRRRIKRRRLWSVEVPVRQQRHPPLWLIHYLKLHNQIHQSPEIAVGRSVKRVHYQKLHNLNQINTVDLHLPPYPMVRMQRLWILCHQCQTLTNLKNQASQVNLRNRQLRNLHRRRKVNPLQRQQKFLKNQSQKLQRFQKSKSQK